MLINIQHERTPRDARQRTFLFATFGANGEHEVDAGNILERPHANELEVIAKHLKSKNGQTFRLGSDSLFGAFRQADTACLCALTMRDAIRETNGRDGESFNATVVISTGNDARIGSDYYGEATDRASRIAQVAHPGQILCTSETVDEIAASTLLIGSILPLGRYKIDGLRNLVSIFQISRIHDFESFTALKAPQARTTNVEAAATKFIGRGMELASIDEWMQRGRQLTLTGLGGVGKSRIATEWARSQDRVDGCWLIDLAELTEATLVAQLVSRTLDISETPTEPSVTTLCKSLRPLRTMLVFDNCEHMRIQVAAVAERILADCPLVSILATSREPLGLPSEKLFTVQPLSCARSADGIGTSNAEILDSVALFVDRAVGQRVDYAPSAQALSDIASVCNRLDGIPLAIELAAARVKALPTDLFEARILSSIDILDEDRSGGRARTVASVIRAMLETMPTADVAILMRLTVFRAGFTEDSATTVCAFGDILQDQVKDAITRLSERSLVSRCGGQALPRFKLLSTVRDILSGIRRAPDTEEAALYHARWACGIAERVEPMLATEKSKVMSDIEADLPDFQLVMSRSLDALHPEFGLRVCAALYAYWIVRGTLKEPIDWLTRLLEVDVVDRSAHVTAKAWSALGGLARAAGSVELAIGSFEAALEIWEHEEAAEGMADALNNLGIMATDLGRSGEAKRLLVRALDFYRASHDVQGMSACLINLGLLALATGAFEAARSRFEESANFDRFSKDEWGVATSLAGLGRALTELNQPEIARQDLTESLRLRLSFQDLPGMIESVEGLAILASSTGEDAQSAVMMGAAMAARTQCAIPVPGSAKKKLSQVVRRLEVALGQDRLSVLMRAGRSAGIQGVSTRLVELRSGAAL